MAEYLRVLWHHDHPAEPVELFYEVQPDRRVTRLIEVFRDGAVLADTLEWSARRNPRLSSNVCLCDGGFPPAEDFGARFGPPEFDYHSINASAFDAQFDRAQPKS